MAGDFFQQYFVDSVVQRAGYNPVNTITYAITALLALFLIFKTFKKYGVEIDRRLFWGVLAFTLFGASLRVVSDAKDSGVLPMDGIYSAIRAIGFYGYGFLTVSPGIYIMVAAIFLASLFFSCKIAKNKSLAMWMGLALAATQLALLLPLVKFPLAAAVALAMAAVPFSIAWQAVKEKEYAAIIGAQALDGAATFVSMDLPSLAGAKYSTVGIGATMAGSMAGSYLPFFALKVLLASAVVYMLVKDNEYASDEKLFVAIAATVIGLAPGLHDLLRLSVGA